MANRFYLNNINISKSLLHCWQISLKVRKAATKTPLCVHSRHCIGPSHYRSYAFNHVSTLTHCTFFLPCKACTFSVFSLFSSTPQNILWGIHNFLWDLTNLWQWTALSLFIAITFGSQNTRRHAAVDPCSLELWLIDLCKWCHKAEGIFFHGRLHNVRLALALVASLYQRSIKLTFLQWSKPNNNRHAAWHFWQLILDLLQLSLARPLIVRHYCWSSQSQYTRRLVRHLAAQCNTCKLNRQTYT